MLLEWLRRRDEALSRHLKTYLFSEGSIPSLETAPKLDASLHIASLRGEI